MVRYLLYFRYVHYTYNAFLAVAIDNETECAIKCHNHFYCENNFCRPRCDQFREYSDEYLMLADGLTVTAASLGLICSIVVLVLFYLRRKSL